MPGNVMVVVAILGDDAGFFVDRLTILFLATDSLVKGAEHSQLQAEPPWIFGIEVGLFFECASKIAQKRREMTLCS